MSAGTEGFAVYGKLLPRSYQDSGPRPDGWHAPLQESFIALCAEDCSYEAIYGFMDFNSSHKGK